MFVTNDDKPKPSHKLDELLNQMCLNTDIFGQAMAA
jgi:hypothetical protein